MRRWPAFALGLLVSLLSTRDAHSTVLCVVRFANDGECDERNNVEACDWDGGDCCDASCLSQFDLENMWMCGNTECRDPSFFHCTYPGAQVNGDGICDLDFNTEECSWDGGDCCLLTCSGALCSGEFCADPGSIPEPQLPPVEECDASRAGNGICDAINNNEKCQFDGNDCCRPSCEASGHPDCGAAGYDCRDPSGTCETPGNSADPTTGECVPCPLGSFDRKGNTIGPRSSTACLPCSVGRFGSTELGATSEEEACPNTCADHAGFWPNGRVGGQTLDEACNPTCPLGHFRGDATPLTSVQRLRHGDEAPHLSEGDFVDRIAALSPDSNYLYVAGSSRDGEQGAIEIHAVGDTTHRVVGKVSDGDLDSRGDSIKATLNVTALRVSPNGLYLDAASNAHGRGKVATFSIDPRTGLLEHLQTVSDGDVQDGRAVEGLDGASSMSASPCGKHVYVAAMQAIGMSVFERHESGRLIFVESTRRGNALGFIADSYLTKDGRHLYAVSARQSSLAVFERNETSGLLALRDVISAHQTRAGQDLGQLVNATRVTGSPDGQQVFVLGPGVDGMGTVLSFSRNFSSGLISLADTLNDRGLYPDQNTLRIEEIYSSAAFLKEGPHLLAHALVALRDERESVDHVVTGEAYAQVLVTVTYRPRLNVTSTHPKLNVTSTLTGVAAASVPPGSSGSIAFRPHAHDVFVAGPTATIEHYMCHTGGRLTAIADTESGANADALLLQKVQSIAVSPCGRHAIAASEDSNAVLVFNRDAISSQLSLAETYGLGQYSEEGPHHVVMASNGEDCFIAVRSGVILRMMRYKTSGRLTRRQTISGIASDAILLLTGDGETLYALSAANGTLGTFLRNSTTGDFANQGWMEEHQQSGGLEVVGLRGATSIVESPDGRFVFVACPGLDSVARFARPAGTSTSLTFLGRTAGLSGARSLGFAQGYLLVLASKENSVMWLSWDEVTGSLTQVGAIRNGFSGDLQVSGLSDADAIATSADSTSVYVVSSSEASLAYLAWNAAGDSLELVGVETVGDRLSRDSPWSLTVSPDSRDVYLVAPSQSAIFVYRAFDDCATCPVGSKCAAGSNLAQNCQPGEYQNESGQTSCKSCDVGRYQDQAGQEVCPVCFPGFYAPAGATACTACPNGTSSGALYIGSADECTPCKPGTVASAADGDGNIRCVACEPGKYSNEDLSLCVDCPEARYSPSAGINMESCVMCAPGFKGIPGVVGATQAEQACSICPGGSYRGFEEDPRACSACTEGRWAPAGAASCEVCPTGTYANASQSCEDCDAGYACESGIRTACPADTIPSANKGHCERCQLCKAGEYFKEACSASDGGSSEHSCGPCPAGKFQDATEHSDEICLPCPVNAFCQQGATHPTECPEGKFLLTQEKARLERANETSFAIFEERVCATCTDGMRCRQRGQTLETLQLEQDYYRPWQWSYDVRDCPHEGACLGGASYGDASCAEGHVGVLCAVCVPGRFFDSQTESCEECNASAVALALLPALIATLIVVSLCVCQCADSARKAEAGQEASTTSTDEEADQQHEFIRAISEQIDPEFEGPQDAMRSVHRNREDWLRRVEGYLTTGSFQSLKAKLKAYFSNLQMSLLLIDAFRLPRPLLYNALAPVMRFLSFAAFSELSGECFLNNALGLDPNFYSTLVATTATPLLLVLGIHLYCRLRKPPESWRETCDYLMLFVVFLSFPSAIAVSFMTFHCEDYATEDDPAASFLVADYSIKCNDPLHGRFEAYALVMMILYALTPAYYWFLFTQTKEAIAGASGDAVVALTRSGMLNLLEEVREITFANEPGESVARGQGSFEDLLFFATHAHLQAAYKHRLREEEQQAQGDASREEDRAPNDGNEPLLQERPSGASSDDERRESILTMSQEQNADAATEQSRPARKPLRRPPRNIFRLFCEMISVCLYPEHPFWEAARDEGASEEFFKNAEVAIKKHLSRTRFLTEDFKPGFYMFEVVECFRRVTISSLPLMFSDQTAAFRGIGLLIVLVFVFVYFMSAPYSGARDNHAAVLSQAVVVVLFIYWTLEAPDVTESDGRARDGLLFINILLLMLTGILVVLSARDVHETFKTAHVGTYFGSGVAWMCRSVRQLPARVCSGHGYGRMQQVSSGADKSDKEEHAPEHATDEDARLGDEAEHGTDKSQSENQRESSFKSDATGRTEECDTDDDEGSEGFPDGAGVDTEGGDADPESARPVNEPHFAFGTSRPLQSSLSSAGGGEPEHGPPRMPDWGENGFEVYGGAELGDASHASQAARVSWAFDEHDAPQGGASASGDQSQDRSASQREAVAQVCLPWEDTPLAEDGSAILMNGAFLRERAPHRQEPRMGEVGGSAAGVASAEGVSVQHIEDDLKQHGMQVPPGFKGPANRVAKSNTQPRRKGSVVGVDEFGEPRYRAPGDENNV